MRLYRLFQVPRVELGLKTCFGMIGQGERVCIRKDCSINNHGGKDLLNSINILVAINSMVAFKDPVLDHKLIESNF